MDAQRIPRRLGGWEPDDLCKCTNCMATVRTMSEWSFGGASGDDQPLMGALRPFHSWMLVKWDSSCHCRMTTTYRFRMGWIRMLGKALLASRYERYLNSDRSVQLHLVLTSCRA